MVSVHNTEAGTVLIAQRRPNNLICMADTEEFHLLAKMLATLQPSFLAAPLAGTQLTRPGRPPAAGAAPGAAGCAAAGAAAELQSSSGADTWSADSPALDTVASRRVREDPLPACIPACCRLSGLPPHHVYHVIVLQPCDGNALNVSPVGPS